jgi:hypothetical protein
MTSLKHKASSEGGDRTRSLPMTKDSMEKMVSWALDTCLLLETALHSLERAFDDMSSARTDPALELNLKEREVITRHLEHIAFDVTAWTLWTRQVPALNILCLTTRAEVHYVCMSKVFRASEGTMKAHLHIRSHGCV